MPIAICFSSGCAWYHGFPPMGSLLDSTQRGSFVVTVNSGESHGMSRYGLKLRCTDPADRVSSLAQ